MPNIRSAAKRLRSSAKRHARNQQRKSVVRTAEKKLLAKIEAKDVAGAQDALKACFRSLDQAAKLGSIHSNKADRKKSRLTARVTALAAVKA